MNILIDCVASVAIGYLLACATGFIYLRMTQVDDLTRDFENRQR